MTKPLPLEQNPEVQPCRAHDTGPSGVNPESSATLWVRAQSCTGHSAVAGTPWMCVCVQLKLPGACSVESDVT